MAGEKRIDLKFTKAISKICRDFQTDTSDAVPMDEGNVVLMTISENELLPMAHNVKIAINRLMLIM